MRVQKVERVYVYDLSRWQSRRRWRRLCRTLLACGILLLLLLVFVGLFEGLLESWREQASTLPAAEHVDELGRYEQPVTPLGWLVGTAISGLVMGIFYVGLGGFVLGVLIDVVGLLLRLIQVAVQLMMRVVFGITN